MKIELELDNLTKEEQETVKRLAKKGKQPYFVPKKQERYYFYSDGEVLTTFYDCLICDDLQISIGNCFRTREEAEEAITKLQMQTKWARLSLDAGEADNPWDGHHKHFFISWDCVDKILDTDFNQGCCGEKTYFPTKESLKAAIVKLGAENVKRYILGVTS